jgi:hypothetical protein
MSNLTNIFHDYLAHTSALVSVIAVIYSIDAARRLSKSKERKLVLINQYYKSILDTYLNKHDIYKSSKAIQETLDRLSKIINDNHNYGASASFKIFSDDGSKNIRTFLRDINNSNNREILVDTYPLLENKLFLESYNSRKPVFINNINSPKDAIYFNTNNGDWKSTYGSVWVFPVTEPKSQNLIGFLTIDTKERVMKNSDIYRLASDLGESTANYIANLVSSIRPHNKKIQPTQKARG